MHIKRLKIRQQNIIKITKKLKKLIEDIKISPYKKKKKHKKKQNTNISEDEKQSTKVQKKYYKKRTKTSL